MKVNIGSNLKAFILDLDNTIFPVSAIAYQLFGHVFDLIEQSGEYQGDFQKIKLEMMRRPLLLIGKEFSFSEKLLNDCFRLFENLTHESPIATFPDYPIVRDLPFRKYLVTTGFPKLQNSKIDQLGIRPDFEKIYTVDPFQSPRTKKDIFVQIMQENSYQPEDLIVIGDDLNSEIRAAQELGIEAVLYDYAGQFGELTNLKVITNYGELSLD